MTRSSDGVAGPRIEESVGEVVGWEAIQELDWHRAETERLRVLIDFLARPNHAPGGADPDPETVTAYNLAVEASLSGIRRSAMETRLADDGMNSPLESLLSEPNPMSAAPLSPEVLEELRRFNSPTISNAIEIFNVRPRHLGFLPHTVRSLFPDMQPMVGYAVTSRTRARFSPDKELDLTADYLRYVAAAPGPKIAVGQDLDDPPGLGAQFGEVNATIHKKLGCVGHITDGCPRDLDEVRELGFQLFGLNPCVSHAYVRLVEFGKPVKIAGAEILPGDLIHADKHGVCIIPLEVAPKLAEACREVERLEKPLLELCRSNDFDLEEYIKRRGEMKVKIRE